MIVAFFRIHGKKSLQTLLQESKLALAAPMNMAFDIWEPFNDLIQLFFEYFEDDYRPSELEKEVTTLISCFVGVGLTHDKLVEAHKNQSNFVNNLRSLLNEFCYSMAINPEDLKDYILWYLENGRTKKEEEAESRTKLEAILANPNVESAVANPWQPFKTMYELFVASFKSFYSTHEIVRGGKLVVSSLIHAGMIHDTMKAIYRQEVESESTNAEKEMKNRFVEILEHNFPKIQSIPIPIDDLASFLVHYCKKTFVGEGTNPAEGEATVGGSSTNSAGRNREALIQKRKRGRGNKKKKASGAKVFRQVIARQERGAKIAGDSSDGDESTPTDALTTCRRKLSAMLPKNEESDEYKEFVARFNSLFMVSLILLHVRLVAHKGGRWLWLWHLHYSFCFKLRNWFQGTIGA